MQDGEKIIAVKQYYTLNNIFHDWGSLDLMNKIYPFSRRFSKKLQPHRLKADAVFINEVLGY
jgi:hypothetical protein